MSADRDVTRIVRSWLEDGPTALPDRVLDNVLDQLPATPQRRAWWPAWRLREMNNTFRIALAAAAVVVVAVVGINLLPRQGGGVGGLAPTPPPTASLSPSLAPTASPSPTPSPIVNKSGTLVPGITYVINDPCCTLPGGISFTVPATGWSTGDIVQVSKNEVGDPEGFDIYMSPHIVKTVFSEQCQWLRATRRPVGPTADDLAVALAEQQQPGDAPPTDVVIGGHLGKKIELSMPDGLQLATCDKVDGFPVYGRWATDSYGANPWTFGDGQRSTVYIIEVDGKRQVIDTMYLPGTSEANLAELEALVQSIRFEP